MELKKYLQHHDFTQHSFLEMIKEERGLSIPQSTFAKWITGQRIPRKNEMIILYEITNKNVQPNDFYLTGLN